MKMPKGFEKVGEIGVDAGLCWIGDPCYVMSPDASNRFESWDEFLTTLNKTEKDGAAQFNYRAGHPGLGVCVGTGHGDGTYDVIVRRVKGRVMEVRVIFDEAIDE